MELRLAIDKTNLDGEWETQAQQVHQWCTAQAAAQLALDQARTRLAVRRGKLEVQIRADPTDFGLDKATEASVAAALASNPGCAKLQEEIDQCRYELSAASAAVEALQHRKRALTCLIELWQADYFSAAAGRRNSTPTSRPPGVRQEPLEDDIDSE